MMSNLNVSGHPTPSCHCFQSENRFEKSNE